LVEANSFRVIDAVSQESNVSVEGLELDISVLLDDSLRISDLAGLLVNFSFVSLKMVLLSLPEVLEAILNVLVGQLFELDSSFPFLSIPLGLVGEHLSLKELTDHLKEQPFPDFLEILSNSELIKNPAQKKCSAFTWTSRQFQRQFHDQFLTDWVVD
jgi:hypothetical protein